jgi:hypothetical protein
MAGSLDARDFGPFGMKSFTFKAKQPTIPSKGSTQSKPSALSLFNSTEDDDADGKLSCNERMMRGTTETHAYVMIVSVFYIVGGKSGKHDRDMVRRMMEYQSKHLEEKAKEVTQSLEEEGVYNYDDWKDDEEKKEKLRAEKKLQKAVKQGEE